MVATCPSENTEVLDQSNFWNDGGINWDAHRIGWAIAGGCAALVSSNFTYYFLKAGERAWGVR